MAKEKITRRALLGHGVRWPLAGTALWALSACTDNKKKVVVCADPDSMSATEKSMRNESHYVEAAPDPTRTCSGCKYFEPDEGGGACGKCNIFQGPANARGHCDSWAVRQA